MQGSFINNSEEDPQPVVQLDRANTGNSDVFMAGQKDDVSYLSGMWRSEPMELRSMNIERSVLERVMRAFGELGCAQFKDLNATSNWNEAPTEEELAAAKHRRQYVSQIRTCEAIERRLRYLDEKFAEYRTKVDERIEPAGPLGLDEFAGNTNIADVPDILETLNNRLASEEKTIQEQSAQFTKNEKELRKFITLRTVADWAERMCSSGNNTRGDGLNTTLMSDRDETDREDRSLLVDMQQQESGSLGQLIGIIAVDKFDTFQRLIYRVTKGNAVVMREELDNQMIFRIVYSAFETQARITKLALSVGADLYLGRVLQSYGGAHTDIPGIEMLPQSPAEFMSLKAQVERNVQDCERMIENTKTLLFQTLRTLARVQQDRRYFVLKEKGMYHTLNMMQIEPGASFANAVAWMPRRKVALVQDLLQQYDMCHLGQTDLAADGTEAPPTHYETNDFTGSFQSIVDSYGVPCYQEANPAPFLIITFPWLFGVMYGDIGHGLIITFAGFLMILFQRKLKAGPRNEMFDMVFGARWLILLMGLFATYAGFLYNDTFGMMLEYSDSKFLFPTDWVEANNLNTTTSASCWKGGPIPNVCTPCKMEELRMVHGRCACPGDAIYFDPPAGTDLPFDYICPVFINSTVNTMHAHGGAIPFGIDAGWHETDNKLTFLNGFKMKNAVILGVVQMTLGTVISLFNHLYFKKYEKIWFGFLPEIVFLYCSFGYMCFMIILKWVKEWPNTNIAPNILDTMTNFFLSPGSYKQFDQAACDGPEQDCSGLLLLYDGQTTVQVALILACVVSVPLMLFPIPCLANQRKKKLDKEGKDSSHIDMQEVTIRQVIHVIEYVLGCVSNTASYLRLWALSLAHAQLSDVFWKFTIMMGLNMGMKGAALGFVMYFMWGAWFSATLGVLICMEALSAFLHTLRLHWVEFQNKFYVGDGNRFTPLCFETIIEESETGGK